MEQEKFDKKPLSVNGWIALVILIVITFGIYYYIVFPKLVNQNQTLFYRQVALDNENTPFQMEANIPINLSDFQESKLTINIACPKAKNGKIEGCSGLLDLVSFLVKDQEEVIGSHVNLTRLDIKDQPAVIRNLHIKYALRSYEIMSIPVHIQIPAAMESDFVAFSIYVNEPQELVLTWSNAEKECKSDSTWICANIDHGEALRHSAVENLLLPPWSNRVIPFIAFAMVWLAEQVLPKQKTRGDQPSAWALVLTILSAFFLFLVYAILNFTLLKYKPVIACLFATLLLLCIIVLPRSFLKNFSRDDV